MFRRKITKEWLRKKGFKLISPIGETEIRWSKWITLPYNDYHMFIFNLRNNQIIYKRWTLPLDSSHEKTVTTREAFQAFYEKYKK